MYVMLDLYHTRFKVPLYLGSPYNKEYGYVIIFIYKNIRHFFTKNFAHDLITKQHVIDFYSDANSYSSLGKDPYDLMTFLSGEASYIPSVLYIFLVH